MGLSRPPLILTTAAFPTAFNREIFQGMVAYARQHTPWRLVCRVDVSVAEQQELKPAGLLATGAHMRNHRCAHAAGIPVVMIHRTLPDRRASLVSIDEAAIGAMAADYFISMGLKHMAYVGRGPWAFVRARRDGFVKAGEVRGRGPVHELLEDAAHGEHPGFERQLRAMLRGLPRPCGVLAANDEMGVRVVQTCRDIRLRVPEEIAVLGVDNDHLACELSDVPLSSIAQPLVAIGYEAARLLHQHLEGKRPYPAQLLLPPLRVVARASSDLIALDDEDVVAALRLINAHFAEPINVSWIVRQLPVTQRTLYNKFQRLVGRTVLQQIHHVRFQKAKELLSESDLSLAVVAQRSGFANPTWMADSFRRELGTTPNRFRRQFRTES